MVIIFQSSERLHDDNWTTGKIVVQHIIDVIKAIYADPYKSEINNHLGYLTINIAIHLCTIINNCAYLN